MRSLKTFKDDFGVVRKNGEEWLITVNDTETHIPNVYEEVNLSHKKKITFKLLQWSHNLLYQSSNSS